jgi:hypothetical protein
MSVNLGGFRALRARNIVGEGCFLGSDRQRLEPSLTTQRAVSESSGFCSVFRKAKAGAFAYDVFS